MISTSFCKGSVVRASTFRTTRTQQTLRKIVARKQSGASLLSDRSSPARGALHSRPARQARRPARDRPTAYRVRRVISATLPGGRLKESPVTEMSYEPHLGRTKAKSEMLLDIRQVSFLPSRSCFDRAGASTGKQFACGRRRSGRGCASEEGVAEFKLHRYI